MIISFKNLQLNLEHFSEFNPQKKSILFLHGFTGKAADWKDSANNIDNKFNKIALDLIGHGKSSSPAEIDYYKIESIIEQVEHIITHLGLKKIILCGYSMGGRAALRFALAKPELVSALIIESTSAGIKNQKEREERIQKDNELAAFVEKNTMENFVDTWLNKEIFGTIKRFSNAKIKQIKEEKIKNTRSGLANSLRAFGTGTLTYPVEKMKKMNLPVLLLSGQLDSKFTKLNVEMNKLIPKSKHIVIKSAGHNIHLEEPKKFISAVNKFLKPF